MKTQNTYAGNTMESGHTPGPWELSYDQGSYRDIMTKDARICTVRHGYVSRETYHANARLIAAAPQLLEACEQAEHWLQEEAMSYGRTQPVMILECLRAAIAAATKS